jgi:hypothetical protein
MRDRRRKNVATSAGRVPWVSIDIVEAVASREQRCRAVGPPYIRGCSGRNRAVASAQFRHIFGPDRIACATGFGFLS